MLRPGCFHGNRAGNSSRWHQHGTGIVRSSRFPLNKRRRWGQTSLRWSAQANTLTLQLTYANALATWGTGAAGAHRVRGTQGREPWAPVQVQRKMAAPCAPCWARLHSPRPGPGGLRAPPGSPVEPRLPTRLLGSCHCSCCTREGTGALAVHLGHHFFSLVMDKRPGRFGVF